VTPRIGYHEALHALQRRRVDEIVITHETACRVWPRISTQPDLDVEFLGCLGKASSFALGLAIGRPDRRVWLIDADGALVMNLGTLITEAQQAPRNLVHFVWENDVYEFTGGQPIPGAGIVDFAAVARACGFPRAYTFNRLVDLEGKLAEVISGEALTFVAVKVAQAGAEITPIRLVMREHIHHLRELLGRAEA
jgi:thiamine pyrophosphate-dependent acetolactate synthase large subunit-like protein